MFLSLRMIQVVLGVVSRVGRVHTIDAYHEPTRQSNRIITQPHSRMCMHMHPPFAMLYCSTLTLRGGSGGVDGGRGRDRGRGQGGYSAPKQRETKAAQFDGAGGRSMGEEAPKLKVKHQKWRISEYAQKRAARVRR